MSEKKMFGVISPPRDLLPSIIIIINITFLCLWFVVSQSFMPVELFVYLAEQNALP